MSVNINSEYYLCVAKDIEGKTYWAAVVEDCYSRTYLDTGVEMEASHALADLRQRGYIVTETKISTQKLELVLDQIKI